MIDKRNTDAAFLPLRTAINAKAIGARARCREREKAGRTGSSKNATWTDTQSILLTEDPAAQLAFVAHASAIIPIALIKCHSK